MIVDRLEHEPEIPHLAARLRQGLEWLRTTDVGALPAGRHDIDGDRLYALVQQYTTRSPDECRWEAHRMYADIQYVVSGVERIGHAPLADAHEREPYDGARDVAFFEPGDEFVVLHPGMFAIFLPEDVHAPCGAADKPAAVRKIVLKVAAGH
jgi:YhcH/YjgK/YiaL family protein